MLAAMLARRIRCECIPNNVITHARVLIAAHPLYICAPFPKSMKSTQVFKRVRYWIKNCQSHHKTCTRRMISAVLSTRLVPVQRASTGLSAHLCNDQSLPMGTRFLTLSHCWSSKEFLTLTRNNRDRFQDSIPIQRLAKTFQNALYARVELGFGYIWIDSLCIVQKDTAD
jgi:hypothetical protein